MMISSKFTHSDVVRIELPIWIRQYLTYFRNQQWKHIC